MALLLDVLSWLLLVGGGLAVLIGGIGVIRLPDVFTRLHAAGITDTLGALLIIAGLLLQAGGLINVFKLLMILLFLLFTSPVASHALAKSALAGGVKPAGAEEERTGG